MGRRLEKIGILPNQLLNADVDFTVSHRYQRTLSIKISETLIVANGIVHELLKIVTLIPTVKVYRAGTQPIFCFLCTFEDIRMYIVHNDRIQILTFSWIWTSAIAPTFLKLHTIITYSYINLDWIFLILSSQPVWLLSCSIIKKFPLLPKEKPTSFLYFAIYFKTNMKRCENECGWNKACYSIQGWLFPSKGNWLESEWPIMYIFESNNEPGPFFPC